ncbi:MAG: nuclear transport factor 2 family protein, partial [Actinomycetota bacterium]
MTSDTERVVEAFTAATNRHDLDAMLTLVADDVIFESTTPLDGDRIEGKRALRAVWEQVFRDSPRASIETEELVVIGDRGVARVRYVFDGDRPEDGHVRALDGLRVVDGKLTEKLSYV